MKAYISNAFSLNMVSGDTLIRVSESSPDRVPVDAVSAIGHESTAQVVSALLGRTVPMNRVAVSLEPSDELYVVTLFEKSGKPFRAPEGSILGQEELSALRLAIRQVEVLGPQSKDWSVPCVACGGITT